MWLYLENGDQSEFYNAYAEPLESTPYKSSTSLMVKEIRQAYNGKVVVGHDLDIH